MKDPYEKVWEEIRKGFDLNIKMIKWIAERTLSVKDYKEFIDEFTENDAREVHNCYEKMETPIRDFMVNPNTQSFWIEKKREMKLE